MTQEEYNQWVREHGFGTGSSQTDTTDPNQQRGVDQYGNPVNAYGLPLGQRPPNPEDQYNQQRQAENQRLAQENSGTPGGNWAQGAWNSFSGKNSFNPMEGGPMLTPPTMDAAQMQAAGMNTAQADTDRNLSLSVRNQQSALGDALMARALGTGGPSVAELQMQRGIGLAQQAAAHQAASARGIGRGLANYGAANAQANLAAQGVQDAAALRAQEQIAAQGTAQKGLSDQRMQDLTSRGMSVQQAQAIMDAENRARETNMTATNRARENNMNAYLQAGQANLQADTSRRGQTVQTSEGNAQRKQGFVGKLVSDVRAKQDVQPLLYSHPLDTSNPYDAPRAAPAPAAPVDGIGPSKETQIAQAIARQQQLQQPQESAIKPMSMENPYDNQQQQSQGKSSGIIEDVVGMISDKRAKTDAFLAGMKLGVTAAPAPAPAPAPASSSTPMLKKAGVSSAPVFELSPDRVRRMGRSEFHQAVDERERRQKLADAFKFMGEMHQMAPIIRNDVEMPAPVAPASVPVAPTQTSDKRAKYTYSDKRAKELEGENEELKRALEEMGNKVSGDIRSGLVSRGVSAIGDALGKLGNDADVSRTPTAVYPDIDPNTGDKLADAARNANPPPPYQYRYKDEFAAKQGTDTEPRLGIMAQDALKSPVYRPAVVKMPDGMLGIDSNRLLHANTAMLSGEHERINQVEAQNAALAQALDKIGNEQSYKIKNDIDFGKGQSRSQPRPRSIKELIGEALTSGDYAARKRLFGEAATMGEQMGALAR